MSTSLRDQLLRAGLVSQKQVNDAERRQQHERHKEQSKPQRRAAPTAPVAAPAVSPEKLARDQALNRQREEKAKRKALLAEMRQLIVQNSVPRVEGEDLYHFVDGGKVRHVPVTPAIRESLGGGKLVIIRYEGRYHFAHAASVSRICERDPRTVVIATVAADNAPVDPAYEKFAVPDDLRW